MTATHDTVITFLPGRGAAAVRNRFHLHLGLLGVAALASSLLSQGLLPAVGLSGLAVWAWHGWMARRAAPIAHVTLTPRHIRWGVADQVGSVRRQDIGALDIESRGSPFQPIDVLSVRDTAGTLVLCVGLPDRSATINALARHGWPHPVPPERPRSRPQR